MGGKEARHLPPRLLRKTVKRGRRPPSDCLHCAPDTFGATAADSAVAAGSDGNIKIDARDVVARGSVVSLSSDFLPFGWEMNFIKRKKKKYDG